MAKKRINNSEEQRARIAKANEERAERARAKKEYDAVYRKSTFFRTTVVLRALIILFAVYMNALDGVYFHTKAEVIASVENKMEEVVQNVSTKLSLVTESQQVSVMKYSRLITRNDQQYTVDMEEAGDENSFKAGDTILVQHTIVGKPSYIANARRVQYFPVKQFVAFKYTFLFAGMVMLISLFMTSGYDLSARLFVQFATVAGLVILALYFIV